MRVRGQVMVLIFLLLFHAGLMIVVRGRCQASGFDKCSNESEDFRWQDISQDLLIQIETMAEEQDRSFSGILTATMLHGDFRPTEVCAQDQWFRIYKEEAYETMLASFQAIWEDLEYFPVPSSEISFEDSWMTARTYGGERRHEGCDLFGKHNSAGYYPVVSITDGVVENIGWLPLGGYRIGIRSPHGGYFYYAHLDSYEKEFVPGETVQAGEILGFMGDSGYGEEGTRGKFPVHLHLGIYIRTHHYKEISVNPYSVLLYLKKNRLRYTY